MKRSATAMTDTAVRVEASAAELGGEIEAFLGKVARLRAMSPVTSGGDHAGRARNLWLCAAWST